MQQAWWVPQDPLGLLGTQASRDPMGTLALGAFLASWEPWVRSATRGPRENVERRATRETQDVAIPGCLGPQGSQDFLAGLARQSTARMEIEGPQVPLERQADLAYQALWGFQASVSLRPASEPQPTPLHASRSLDPSRGHEHQARTELSGHPGGKGLGPLWVDKHRIPQPRNPAFPGLSVWDLGVLRTRKI